MPWYGILLINRKEKGGRNKWRWSMRKYCNKKIKEWVIAAWRENMRENLIYKVLRWLEWECRTINLFCVSVESNNAELHVVNLQYERLVQSLSQRHHSDEHQLAAAMVDDSITAEVWHLHQEKMWCLQLFKKHSPCTGYTIFVRRCLNCVTGPFVSLAGMKSRVHAERLQESRRRREFTVRMQDEAHRS